MSIALSILHAPSRVHTNSACFCDTVALTGVNIREYERLRNGTENSSRQLGCLPKMKHPRLNLLKLKNGAKSQAHELTWT
jgi:hypothetical protein